MHPCIRGIALRKLLRSVSHRVSVCKYGPEAPRHRYLLGIDRQKVACKHDVTDVFKNASVSSLFEQTVQTLSPEDLHLYSCIHATKHAQSVSVGSATSRKSVALTHLSIGRISNKRRITRTLVVCLIQVSFPQLTFWTHRCLGRLTRDKW